MNKRNALMKVRYDYKMRKLFNYFKVTDWTSSVCQTRQTGKEALYGYYLRLKLAGTRLANDKTSSRMKLVLKRSAFKEHEIIDMLNPGKLMASGYWGRNKPIDPGLIAGINIPSLVFPDDIMQERISKRRQLGNDFITHLSNLKQGSNQGHMPSPFFGVVDVIHE